MRTRCRTLALMGGMTIASMLRAQTLDTRDKVFARAAAIVLGHDLLAARCLERLTFSPEASATIAAWVRDNDVERIRERTRVVEQDRAQRRQFDMIRRMFALPFSAKGQTACQSAVDATKRLDAQFARNSPQLLAALRAQGGGVATGSLDARDTVVQLRRNGDVGAATTPPPAPTVTATAASVAPDAMAAIAARIDRFGFDSRAAVGVGGFSSLSGVGTVAVGGTSSVAVVSEYTFGADGRVIRGGASGSTTSAGGASVVTSNVAPSRRGRYDIDGVTLRIRYDDGSHEQRILVTDPDDPKSVIWLDGSSYVRR